MKKQEEGCRTATAATPATCLGCPGNCSRSSVHQPGCELLKAAHDQLRRFGQERRVRFRWVSLHIASLQPRLQGRGVEGSSRSRWAGVHGGMPLPAARLGRGTRGCRGGRATHCNTQHAPAARHKCPTGGWSGRCGECQRAADVSRSVRGDLPLCMRHSSPLSQAGLPALPGDHHDALRGQPQLLHRVGIARRRRLPGPCGASRQRHVGRRRAGTVRGTAVGAAPPPACIPTLTVQPTSDSPMQTVAPSGTHPQPGCQAAV